MRKHIQLIFSILLMSATSLLAQDLPFRNEQLTPHQRAMDLVSRLTLKEKVSQMTVEAQAIPRLGIPKYQWWNECLHGVARSGKATIFPQSIGLAATFDDNLIFKMTDAISSEARALYLQAKRRGNEGKYTGLTFFSPNVNLYRDPRWGRGQETFGEDPYLISRIGVAYVKGLQGNDPKYLKTAACAKHFAVHSGPEIMRHGFNAKASWNDLYETYFPAFKALVKEGKVESVMGAYNRTNDEVCCASHTLLQDILRKQWGFKGYVTSDCGALWNFIKDHKVCKTAPEAAALAANNGLNLNCGGVYLAGLEEAVRSKKVNEEVVDSLLVTLLTTRFKLGLFDDESHVCYNDVVDDVVDSQIHKEVAYQTAVESMVLLENKNHLLPLSDKVDYVYVTGPCANNPDALIGNYYGASDHMTTFYEGICGSMPKGMSIQYRQGVMMDNYGYNSWTVREAPEADVVVACVGLTNLLEGEETDAIASRTKGDMTQLELPEAQLKFLRQLRKNLDKVNKKMVVVVAAGSPLILTEVREFADALIYTWYPGEAGGNALGDILFGKVSPSGKTPMTFIRSLSQLPPFEDYNMKGRTYKYLTEEPLYPFGYGLSYAEFEYYDLSCTPKIEAGNHLMVSFKVKNVSQRKADEVIQLYVAKENRELDDPTRRLANFKRVSLQPNEEKVIHLEVNAKYFSQLKNRKRIISSGKYIVSVGGGQPVAKTTHFVQTQIRINGECQLEL